ncbi:unnamed protein product [Urochloa decumbens]|uniref:Uncharacterized protein n=1 Tax=Urochloa decumbens TaxID=240449 RepID=A0ABC9ARM8_9POAL
MPPPWGWLRRALAIGWAPAPAPPQEEEAMLVWDLEAAAPPPTMPGAADCFTGKENTVSCELPSVAPAARFFTAMNLLRGMLSALWVYMIYAMIRFAIDHSDEQGSELIIMFLVLIAVCVTPYCGIASQVLDDVEEQCRV